MAVLQQICLDKMPMTPGGTGDTQITRAQSNKGLLVMFLGATGQGNRTQAAYIAPAAQLTSSSAPAAGTQIRGVLLDYHNSRQCSVGRKGRFKVAMDAAVAAGDIGSAIVHSTTVIGKGDVAAKGTAFSVGEILDFGSDTEIGNYAVVDFNLPDNGPVS